MAQFLLVAKPEVHEGCTKELCTHINHFEDSSKRLQLRTKFKSSKHIIEKFHKRRIMGVPALGYFKKWMNIANRKLKVFGSTSVCPICAGIT
jgi:hypothetical protein